jgi:hypothetical protein
MGLESATTASSAHPGHVNGLVGLELANKPNDKNNDKNGSEYAAADVHENLLTKIFEVHSNMTGANRLWANVRSAVPMKGRIHFQK